MYESIKADKSESDSELWLAQPFCRDSCSTRLPEAGNHLSIWNLGTSRPENVDESTWSMKPVHRDTGHKVTDFMFPRTFVASYAIAYHGLSPKEMQSHLNSGSFPALCHLLTSLFCRTLLKKNYMTKDAVSPGIMPRSSWKQNISSKKTTRRVTMMQPCVRAAP